MSSVVTMRCSEPHTVNKALQLLHAEMKPEATCTYFLTNTPLFPTGQVYRKLFPPLTHNTRHQFDIRMETSQRSSLSPPRAVRYPAGVREAGLPRHAAAGT